MFNELNKSVPLKKILLNKEYEKYFERGYLPKFQIINEEIFIEGINRYYRPNTNEAFVSKFLILTKKGKFTKDSEYEFFPLPKEGYLVKVDLIKPFSGKNYILRYIIDINNVEIYKLFENMDEMVLMNLSFGSSGIIESNIWRNTVAESEFNNVDEFCHNYFYDFVHS